MLFLQNVVEVLIEVVGSVGERAEYEDFPVPWIDGGLHFVEDELLQGLQLKVVLRRDGRDGIVQGIEDPLVFYQTVLPAEVVHVFQLHFYLMLDDASDIIVLIFHFRDVFRHGDGLGAVLELLDFPDCGRYPLADLVHGHAECMDGALQALKEVDSHEPADTLFAACAVYGVVVKIVFVPLRRVNELCRNIDCKREPE